MLALRQKLADDSPSDNNFRNDLAQTHNNIGVLLLTKGKLSEAEAEHRKAFRCGRNWSTVTRRSPNSAAAWPRAATTSARCCLAWASRPTRNSSTGRRWHIG